jgi:hypothetical protein
MRPSVGNPAGTRSQNIVYIVLMDTKSYTVIAYHTNSHSPRAQRWYYLASIVRVDGKYWELHRHPSGISTKSLDAIRKAAAAAGIETISGLFVAAPSPRIGSEMIRTQGVKTS